MSNEKKCVPDKNSTTPQVITFTAEDNKFETLNELISYLSRGWTLGFDYKGVGYGVEGHNNSFYIWRHDGTELIDGITLDEVLDFEIDGAKIKDFILDTTIIERLAT